jgi:sterol desaturase/sphingolipid hydroxylase (fatty acid hydroxylase superfamily)
MIEYLSSHFQNLLVDVLRLSLWFLIICIVFIPLEYLFAARRQPIFRPQLGNDLVYYVLSWLVPPVLMAPVLAVVALIAHACIPNGMLTAIAGFPFWAQALAALVVGDIGYYWGHRMLHSVPFLWRFHAVHHSAEQLDFLVNTRMHPIDMVIGRLSGLIPVYVLGLARPTAAGSTVPVVIMLAGIMWGFYIHSNLRWRYGPLEWLVGTPPFHRWHHAVTPAHQNFASLLPWIDIIFGTYYSPKGEMPRSYGIDTVMPASIAAQLLGPFQPAAREPSDVSERRTA